MVACHYFVSKMHKTNQHLQSAGLNRPDNVHIFTRFLWPRFIACDQPWNISPLSSIWSFRLTFRIKANHYIEIKVSLKSYLVLRLIKLASLPEEWKMKTLLTFIQTATLKRIYVSKYSKWAKALVVSFSSKTDKYQEQKAHADLTASLCFHSAVW